MPTPLGSVGTRRVRVRVRVRVLLAAAVAVAFAVVVLLVCARTPAAAAAAGAAGSPKARARKQAGAGSSHGALVLNDTTFDAALATDGGSPLLVKFYAPWCGACRGFAPVFSAVAHEFRDAGWSPARVAEVDVTRSPVLQYRFGINAIPDVRYIRGARVYSVEGHPRTPEEFADFCISGYVGAPSAALPAAPSGVMSAALSSLFRLQELVEKAQAGSVSAWAIIAAFVLLPFVGMGVVGLCLWQPRDPVQEAAEAEKKSEKERKKTR